MNFYGVTSDNGEPGGARTLDTRIKRLNKKGFKRTGPISKHPALASNLDKMGYFLMVGVIPALAKY